VTTPKHPTAERLIETVSSMLDGSEPLGVTIDEVLRQSGITRGALYHHFGSFPALVEETLIRRFAANVASDGKAMRFVADESTSGDEYWARILELSALTQSRAQTATRLERARLLGLAAEESSFSRALATEQERVTEELSEAIAVAQQKGWVKPELNPRAVATFLQAYSLGRAVDDVAETQVPNEDWLALIDVVLRSFRQDENAAT
jgi:AcrR family transcriptional regulator